MKIEMTMKKMKVMKKKFNKKLSYSGGATLHIIQFK